MELIQHRPEKRRRHPPQPLHIETSRKSPQHPLLASDRSQLQFDDKQHKPSHEVLHEGVPQTQTPLLRFHPRRDPPSRLQQEERRGRQKETGGDRVVLVPILREESQSRRPTRNLLQHRTDVPPIRGHVFGPELLLESAGVERDGTFQHPGVKIRGCVQLTSYL